MMDGGEQQSSEGVDGGTTLHSRAFALKLISGKSQILFKPAARLEKSHRAAGVFQSAPRGSASRTARKRRREHIWLELLIVL